MAQALPSIISAASLSSFLLLYQGTPENATLERPYPRAQGIQRYQSTPLRDRFPPLGCRRGHVPGCPQHAEHEQSRLQKDSKVLPLGSGQLFYQMDLDRHVLYQQRQCYGAL